MLLPDASARGSSDPSTAPAGEVKAHRMSAYFSQRAEHELWDQRRQEDKVKHIQAQLCMYKHPRKCYSIAQYADVGQL
jgi:hypothetical protein